MQKNLSGEARHEAATLKLVKETEFGVTPPASLSERLPRSKYPAVFADATLTVDGKPQKIIKGTMSISNEIDMMASMVSFDIETTGVMIGIDPAAGKDRSVLMNLRPYQRKAAEAVERARSGAITGRMTSNEPVTYHMTREGPPIRMVGGEGADEEDRRRLDSMILETLARKNQDAITRIIMGTFANG